MLVQSQSVFALLCVCRVQLHGQSAQTLKHRDHLGSFRCFQQLHFIQLEALRVLGFLELRDKHNGISLALASRGSNTNFDISFKVQYPVTLYIVSPAAGLEAPPVEGFAASRTPEVTIL